METQSKVTTWSGRVVTGLAVAFLIFDTAIKLAQASPVADAMRDLQIPEHFALGIGVLELACLALYLMPRTQVLGAVMLTGYLGGAIAVHMRLEHPLFSHTLFPTYVGAMLWIGLLLRDARLRALLLTPAPAAAKLAA